MARLIAASPVLLALGACLHNAPMVEAPMALSSAPLEARVWASSFSMGSSITIELSQPAYVAVFEVIPGSGTVLLYPRPGQPALMQAGRSFPHILSGSRFFNASGSAYDWATGNRTVLNDRTAWAQPRHIFLVASENPLSTDALGVWSSRGAGVLTHHAFASFSATATMGRLLDVILPSQTSGQWTTDVYTIWPDPPAPRRDGVSGRTNVPLTLNCGGQFVSFPAGTPIDVIRAQLRSGCQFVQPETPRDTTATPKPEDQPGSGKGPPSTKLPPTSGKEPVAMPVRPNLPSARTEPGLPTARLDGEDPAHDARVRAIVRAGQRAQGPGHVAVERDALGDGDQATEARWQVPARRGGSDPAPRASRPTSTGAVAVPAARPSERTRGAEMTRPGDRARTQPERTRTQPERHAQPVPHRAMPTASDRDRPATTSRPSMPEARRTPPPEAQRAPKPAPPPPARAEPQGEAKTLPDRPKREVPPS